MTDELNEESKVESQKSKVGEGKDDATILSDSEGSPNVQDDLQKKADEYLAGWKRALADYENAMKAQAHSREDDRRRVRERVAEELLPVIDNFGYVRKFVPDTADCSPEFKKKFDTWFMGITHIDHQFTKVLHELGVEPIESVGKKFDPKFHEAGGSKKEESKEDGVVLEEVIKGWKIGDVVIRPAKVIVNEL